MKGNDLSWLPDALQQGIRLHRRIDTFTDNHELVKDLKKTFPKSIRRMSGVCIDIWFDHLLLKSHSDFSPEFQKPVFEDFYQELAGFDKVVKASDESTSVPINWHHFQRVKNGLLTHRWLENYEDADTCMRAFKSVEARLGHRIQFAQQAFIHIKENDTTFVKVFSEFYPQLTDYAMSVK